MNKRVFNALKKVATALGRRSTLFDDPEFLEAFMQRYPEATFNADGSISVPGVGKSTEVLDTIVKIQDKLAKKRAIYGQPPLGLPDGRYATPVTNPLTW